MRKGRINIVTLGCSKNIVDSEKLLGRLKSGGWSVVHDAGDTSADTVIINTCGFIRDAKEESIDTILRFVKASEAGHIRKLFVMGCLAERYADVLRNEIPEVNKYFGVNDIDAILRETGVPKERGTGFERELTGPGHYAYLKVSEGCDRSCAFCAIPLIRGKCISRPVEEIVKEADMLARSGVRELILIAQDLSYYGLDTYRKQMLPHLLKELLKIKHGFEWIRLHYLYPANFPMDLIPVIRDNPVVCRYIDIPVQHITDRMLSLMKRSHGRRETETLLDKLRTGIPGAAIRTTLIAGHPGETDNDYEELKKFVSAFRFDRLGVFEYSHEEGTYSHSNYRDDIPDRIKAERVRELMEIQQAISLEKNQLMIGKTVKVLIDRREGDFFVGRTEHDSPEVDQEVLVPSDNPVIPGSFYDVKITRAAEFDLYGSCS